MARTSLALLGSLVLLMVTQFLMLPLLVTTVLQDASDRTSLTNALTHSLQSNAIGSTTATGVATSNTSRKRPIPDRGPPDGAFNGVPLYLQTATPDLHSNVHCVGENYQRDAWKQRSCRFDFLCFNVSENDFVVFQSAREQALSTATIPRPFVHTSDTMLRWGPNHTQTVSIGGINQKWGANGLRRLEWFPKVVPLPDSGSPPFAYYALPEEMVWTPLHSLNAANPGHLVWDDFFPVYTLLHMFDLLDRHPLLLRYVLKDGLRGLWASCDFRPDKEEACQHLMTKFAPLMWGTESSWRFTASNNFTFVANGDVDGKDRVDLVCARTGVAGMGSLTDHGVTKSHGWMPEDYVLTQNHGRGGMLREFRHYLLSNMGLALPQSVLQERPHRVVFSVKSSSIRNRKMDFERQMGVVSAIEGVAVESYSFQDLSVREQVEIASRTSVFVTACGGAAVTASFLPAGGAVVLYYSETGGYKNNLNTKLPALLDWDVFNAMSYLRVHWMPRNTVDSEIDDQALMLLIEHEIYLMESNALSL
jgi:hypothetical protein